jgi:uncharacterized protein (DUF488 family)
MADGGAESLTIHTIGHSTLTLQELGSRLTAAGVRALADVRRFPASRRHRQFNREALEAGLTDQGIAYRWVEALGGRRAATRESSNAGLKVAAFRAYADYALTEPFRAALSDLEAWGRTIPVAICCAEALWWECHRRLLADHLVTRGWTVLHILRDGKLVRHELWDLARLTSSGPVYPPPQSELFQTGD